MSNLAQQAAVLRLSREILRQAVRGGPVSQQNESTASRGLKKVFVFNYSFGFEQHKIFKHNH